MGSATEREPTVKVRVWGRQNPVDGVVVEDLGGAVKVHFWLDDEFTHRIVVPREQLEDA